MTVEWINSRLGREPLIGSFLQVADPATCELMARTGFDFLCVEAEHSALSRRDLQGMVQIISLHGIACLVRTPDAGAGSIAAALDAGAAGVIVPRVESAAAAVGVAQAARYPPDGARGIGPGRASLYGAALYAYVAEARTRITVGVQIETRTGIDKLDEIAAVEGIDLLFVGPGDLTYSLGLEDAEEDRTVADLIDRVFGVARANGKAAGIYAGTVTAAARWITVGADLVIVASDLGYLAAGLQPVRDDLSHARSGSQTSELA